MGNLLIGFHPSTLLFYDDRNQCHDNRLKPRKPHAEDKDKLLELRNFFNNWKTSKNEFLFFSYRTLCGMLLGGLYGIVLFPAFKISPYLTRKLFLSQCKNDIFPVGSLKYWLGIVAPYYAFAGAVTGFTTSFLSEAYDRAICSNKPTKYLVLGGLDGLLLSVLFGPNGSWSNGLIGGIILGSALVGYASINISLSMGDYGEAAVYMNHVTSEEKQRFEKQEARLGLNYNEL